LLAKPKTLVPEPTSPLSAFYKGGESREKLARQLEGAKIFVRLSSPCNVGRLLGFSFFAESCRCHDDACGVASEEEREATRGGAGDIVSARSVIRIVRVVDQWLPIRVVAFLVRRVKVSEHRSLTLG
jgi:hypothetical protein